MGSNTMKNADKWGAPELGHRKREGYIAAERYFSERGNYCNWNTFKYDDFVSRNALAVTFKKRHLPLSDGKDHPEFGGLLEEPPEWSKKESPVKKGRKKRKATPKQQVEPVKKAKTEVTAAAEDNSDDDDVQMVVDPSTGLVVPLITIE